MFLFRSAVLAKVGCSLLIQLAHAVSVCERGFDFGAELLRGGVVLFQHRALQLVHQRVQAGLDIVQRVRADGAGEAEALGQFVQRFFVSLSSHWLAIKTDLDCNARMVSMRALCNVRVELHIQMRR